MNWGIIATAVVASATLAACTASPAADTGIDQPPAPTTTTAAPVEPAFQESTSCATEPGADVGLESATLEMRSNGLVATWTTDRSLPTRGRVLLSMTIDQYDDAGSGPAYQVGLGAIDGAVTDAYVFDMNSAMNESLDGPARLAGTSATLTVPLDVIPDIASMPGWTATLSIEGTDMSECTP